MATEKQIEANQNNALLSTGAVTEEGKAVVAKNAVKHGIFVKDLIISSGLGKEDEQEYKELFDSLIENLNPTGQMEYLLAEKIAVDFWRLRRVLRFETGSIIKYLDTLLDNYYTKSDWEGTKENKRDEEIDKEIKNCKEHINWNNRYINCLKKGIVSFDNPSWSGEGLESDIEEDFFMVFDSVKYNILTDTEYTYYNRDDCYLDFKVLKELFKKKGLTDQYIADILINCQKKQNEDYKNTIAGLEEQRNQNRKNEEISIKISSLPAVDNAEKVMRYEKSLQKSILQNLVLLKKLQEAM